MGLGVLSIWDKGLGRGVLSIGIKGWDEVY